MYMIKYDRNVLLLSTAKLVLLAIGTFIVLTMNGTPIFTQHVRFHVVFKRSSCNFV